MFSGYTVMLEQHWHFFKRVKGKDLLLLMEEWGPKRGEATHPDSHMEIMS